MKKLRDGARRWWARQPIPFRSAATTALWTFSGTIVLQATRLADDTVTWIDGGARPDVFTSGRVIASAAITAFAGLGNLWYRARRPAPYWPAPAGDATPAPIPNPTPNTEA
jgi:hypothetical protein